MGENIRQIIPSPLPELESMEGCRSGLTRTNSEESSALTVDCSKDFLHHNEIATPDQPTDWTDEKHSLYIDSLEASFVTQLHHSMGLLASHSQEKMSDANSSRKLPTNTRNSSGQFTVLRHGCWQKLKFERSPSLLESAADSHVILENPWVRHFRSAAKRQTVTSPDLREQSALSSERIHLSGKRTFFHGLTIDSEQLPECHLYHQDSVGSISEVSGQNFEDEEQGDKPSSLSMEKRLKTGAADASSKDQVVPFGKFHMTEALTISNDSAEREECVHHEWPSKNPESFVCPESDVDYFLGGS